MELLGDALKRRKDISLKAETATSVIFDDGVPQISWSFFFEKCFCEVTDTPCVWLAIDHRALAISHGFAFPNHFVFGEVNNSRGEESFLKGPAALQKR